MADKQPMQADGGGHSGGGNDGVSEKPGAGESAGGPYPNAHKGSGKRFDGGQSVKEYEGPENPNATTK